MTLKSCVLILIKSSSKVLGTVVIVGYLSCLKITLNAYELKAEFLTLMSAHMNNTWFYEERKNIHTSDACDNNLILTNKFE